MQSLFEHPVDLGAVSAPAAFGFVHVFPGNYVILTIGVLPQCLELGCDRKIRVPLVAGHASVKGYLG